MPVAVGGLIALPNERPIAHPVVWSDDGVQFDGLWHVGPQSHSLPAGGTSTV